MSTDVDYDDDWNWHTPVPDGPMHATADLDGALPCCGGTAVALPPGEGITSDPQRITCQGVPA